MEAINVGIIGFGTVGTGVVKILTQNRDLIRSRLRAEIRIKGIADLDLDSDRGVRVDPSVMTRDAYKIIEDPQIPIVIELIGGHEPARSFILKAIEMGKHVVTANKALLASCGNEIFAAAERKGVALGFEASVGGGIPVIRALKEGLVANRIQLIYGIMNGTSNYILSEMTDRGETFKDVLKKAQEAGYAEADPSFDVEGIDAAHKLTILISLAYGIPLQMEKVYTEGITRITPLDIEFAKELGYKIKLLALSHNEGDMIEARVHPTMVPASSPLGNIDGVYNAFFIEGDAVGSTMFYGLGAGMMPTGSAVVSDLVELCRNMITGVATRVPPLSYPQDSIRDIPIKPMDEVVTNYYLRFSVLDKPGVLSRISGVLARHNISILSVVQKGRKIEGGVVPVVILTHEAKEKGVQQALKEIDRLPITVEPTLLIRIEDKSIKDENL